MTERDTTSSSITSGDDDGRSAMPQRRALGVSLDDDEWFAHVGARVKSAPLGRIGPYELIGEAGRGGQGLVYRARQSRPDRDVALKRLAAGIFATPSMRTRFEREIEAAAALEHPSIVSVYGTEQIDGQLVVALQWIDGVPLDEWAARAPRRSVNDILALFVKVCDAVQHAHQRGVIHRDLKPTNVLIDAADEPHVLDFGLAIRPADESGEARLTLSGAILGTPAFAPPEQLRGDRTAGDARGDVYSLGAMLYQALTGKTPVDATLAPPAIVEQIERSGIRAPHLVDRGVRRDLSTIVMKALQPDPDQRYASVDSLRADLQRFQRGEAVLAHPPSRVYVLRKFVRRNRMAVGFGSLLVLLLTSATATIAVLYANTRQALAEKAVANERMLFELGTNRAVSSFLMNVFVTAGKSGPVAGAQLTVRDVLDRTSEQLLNKQAWTDPVSEAAVRMTVADTYRQLGFDAKAEPHYRTALELRRAALGEGAMPVAEGYDAMARVLRALGRLDEAERYVESAWASYAQVVGPGDGYLARTANSVALVKRSLRKYDEAERWYLIALDNYIRGAGPDSQNIPYVRNNLGALYVSMGRLDDAEASYRDALARSRKLYGATPHLDIYLATSALADLFSKRGDPTGEAEAMFAESRDGMIALFGRNHPRVGALLLRYAQHLVAQRCFDTTEEVLNETASIFTILERWGDVIASAELRAQLHTAMGDSESALARLIECQQAITSRVAPFDPALGGLHLKIATTLLDLNAPVDAAPHLDAAVEIYGLAGGGYESQLQQALALLRQVSGS